MLRFNKQNGFTLVEVLVIIAIIGILSSIIYGSFNGAKAKSRDNKRIADIALIRVALEQYFSAHSRYPLILTDLVPSYMAALPKDPATNLDYSYLPLTRVTSSPYCTFYQLWTKLESTNQYLSNKKGFNSLLVKDDADVNGFFRCLGSSVTGVDATNQLIFDIIPQ